jgi:hypothetical protein
MNSCPYIGIRTRRLLAEKLACPAPDEKQTSHLAKVREKDQSSIKKE